MPGGRPAPVESAVSVPSRMTFEVRLVKEMHRWPRRIPAGATVTSTPCWSERLAGEPETDRALVAPGGAEGAPLQGQELRP